jgi:zinc D-Ala-D-Ala carboxypeptidase
MQLSTHFRLEDFTRSTTATEQHITEQWSPSTAVIDNLTALCVQVLEPLYRIYGNKISITSGWRCPKLNTIKKGSDTSEHLTGGACDIQVTGRTPLEVMQQIVNHRLPFDQIIHEFGRWTHIGLRPNGTNRKQILKAVKIKGKTVYTPLKIQ